MRGYTRVIVAVAACLAASVPTPTHAQISAVPGCPNENAQVSVNFNGMDQDVTAARTKLDAKIAEIKALGAEQNFAKFVVQSFNYSISSNFSSGDPRFQYNVNISFSILPADKAVDFMQLLTKKGYQANVNVSSYNNGNCSRMER